jgi:hypothetical protein
VALALPREARQSKEFNALRNCFGRSVSFAIVEVVQCPGDPSSRLTLRAGCNSIFEVAKNVVCSDASKAAIRMLRRGRLRTSCRCWGETRVQADLSGSSAAHEAITAVKERFGRVDILVNNAGGGAITPVMEQRRPLSRNAIDTNAEGAELSGPSYIPRKVAIGKLFAFLFAIDSDFCA